MLTKEEDAPVSISTVHGRAVLRKAKWPMKNGLLSLSERLMIKNCLQSSMSNKWVSRICSAKESGSADMDTKFSASSLVSKVIGFKF